MAEEQLTLVDGMSPSLRRIYQEAEKLNRRMLTLRSNIKTLEKPTSMSYLKRELKEAEKQAKATEKAIKDMKKAEQISQKTGAFKIGRNGLYYTGGSAGKNAPPVPISTNQMQYAAQSYLNNYYSGISRREAMTRANNFRILRNSGYWSNIAKFNMHMNKSIPLFNLLANSSNKLNYRFTELAGKLYTFQYLFSQVGQLLNSIVQPQDEYIGGLTRSALTSDKTYTPTEIMSKLYDTAIRTRSDAKGTISLYNRIAMSGVNASNDRIMRFVETFNKTMAISGTSGQENRAVMLQLAQGMGSNRLGGDEFRSISEQAPMFKYMLARGMGVNPGALKQMGAEGKLTADAIMKAMENVQDQIDMIYKTAPLTVSQTLTILQTQWKKAMVQNMTGYIELRNALRDLMNWLETKEGSEFLKTIISYANEALRSIVYLGKIVSSVIKFIVQHIKLVSTVLKIFFILFGISTWLKWCVGIRMGFLSVSKAGVAMFGALGKAAIGFGATAAAVLGWIGLIISALFLAWEIGKKIADYVQKRREEKAESFDENLLQQNKMFAWNRYAKQQIKNQGLTLYESSVGGGIGTVEQSEWNKNLANNKYYKNWEKNIWAPKEQQIRQGFDENQKRMKIGKYRETEEQLLQNQYNEMMKANESLMNSSENIPMDVKGGKLDSVGRINDDVSLDNDGIEMMKMIAERQWTVQNEVTVPQKVEVNIDKSVDMNAETIMSEVTQGTRMAAASSMRGVAQPV